MAIQALKNLCKTCKADCFAAGAAILFLLMFAAPDKPVVKIHSKAAERPVQVSISGKVPQTEGLAVHPGAPGAKPTIKAGRPAAVRPVQPTSNGPGPAAPPAGPNSVQQRPRLYTVTAYCPCKRCCGKWSKYKTTASGHKLRFGDKLVAAPSNIPFGTLLLVPGYSDKPVPVLDRGGAIKTGRLDVLIYERAPVAWVTDLQYSHWLAWQWGTKQLQIKTIQPRE